MAGTQHPSPITHHDDPKRVLAVDVGNSRIKWGLHDGADWLVQDWTATANASGLGRAWAKLPRPDGVVACNVAGVRVRQAIVAAARRLRLQARFVASRARQCGVVSSYDRPSQLGPDRWAALIGAWHLFHGPCVVVNAGTAMTADALNGDGVFLGGIIVPGVDLMREALARRTAGLRLEKGRFAFFPARTADAILSGAVNALGGAIERIQTYMREAGLATPLVVVSGGAGGTIASRLNGPVEVVDNLVLEGIVRIAVELRSDR